MLSKEFGRWKRCPVCDDLFAVIHILRITAFFVSTEKDFFQQSLYAFLKYSCMGVPAVFGVRLFILACGGCKGNIPGCRSPPSDFDFASQLKNRNWRKYP